MTYELDCQTERVTKENTRNVIGVVKRKMTYVAWIMGDDGHWQPHMKGNDHYRLWEECWRKNDRPEHCWRPRVVLPEGQLPSTVLEAKSMKLGFPDNLSVQSSETRPP